MNDDMTIEDGLSAAVKTVKLIPIKRGIDNYEAVETDDLTSILKKSRKHESISKEESDHEFKKLKKHLLKQLNFNLPVDDNVILPFLEEAEQEIDRMAKQAIIQKESHSAIIVGQREGFKTFLLEHIVSKISKDFSKQFITIKLNGLIHTELTAINSIATQLEEQLSNIENVDGAKQKMTSIVDISQGSLTEVFEKILHLLDVASMSRQIDDSAKSDQSKVTVLFLFDEIDAFAGPVRQTLLYNLFDMVEHARVPVCIFGCTTKLNILEFLEKRVRSRFSQRIVYMPQIGSREQLLQNIKYLLQIHSGTDLKYKEQWNEAVEAALENESTGLYELVKVNDENYRSIPMLRNSLLPMIGTSSNLDQLMHNLNSGEASLRYTQSLLKNNLRDRTLSLSDLELAILISACRVAVKTKDESVNFNLTYAEYESIVKVLNAKIPTMVPKDTEERKNTIVFDSAIKQWPKRDIKNVWESLLSLGFLAEKSDVGLRESAMAVFYASNYQLQGNALPYDLRVYQMQITLHELRRTIPRSSMYYQWTQL